MAKRTFGAEDSARISRAIQTGLKPAGPTGLKPAGPTVPVGPGNQTAKAPAVAPLSRTMQRDFTIANILGKTAQAIQPGGVGARLGGLGQEVTREKRFNTAFARMLSGDSTPEDFEGLGAEDIQTLQTLRDQETKRKLAEKEQTRKEAETTQKGKEGEASRLTSTIQNALQLSEAGQEDQALQMLQEAGIGAEGDLVTPSERQAKLQEEQNKYDLTLIRQRGVEAVNLENERIWGKLFAQDAEHKANLAEIGKRFGKDPDKLARFNAALSIVRTFQPLLNTEFEARVLLEDSMAAFGLTGEGTDTDIDFGGGSPLTKYVPGAAEKKLKGRKPMQDARQALINMGLDESFVGVLLTQAAAQKLRGKGTQQVAEAVTGGQDRTPQE